MGCLLILVLLAVLSRVTDSSRVIHEWIEDCLGYGVIIPFYTRGMAKSCCQVYPYKMGKHEGKFFEAGLKADPHYIFKSNLLDGDVVYIATADFPDFLDKFMKLPQTTRVVLVTGMEDIGAPWELFHPQRNYSTYTMNGLWPRGQPMDMESFILDPRLSKWFVQNYDLVGCNIFSCSTLTADSIGKDERHKSMASKVVPMPIGLDLHTLSEKQKHVKTRGQINNLLCEQLRDHRAALRSNFDVPFRERPLVVNAEFGCDFAESDNVRQKSRGRLCKLVKRAIEQGDQRFFRGSTLPIEAEEGGSLREKKIRFWSRLVRVAFATAPPGYGMDTHRFWEILSMKTVPIVLSSPLDGLYSNYPVIIVQDWKEIFAQSALEDFRQRILAKWGPNPFSERVIQRLGLSYWVDLVNNHTLTASTVNPYLGTGNIVPSWL